MKFPSSINVNLSFFSFNASNTYFTYVDTTDNTSIVIRLNSSKHPHAPVYDKPIKIYPNESVFIYSEQLNTNTGKPHALPKSLVVSVLPVPAGPAGAPPILRLKA